MNQTWSCLVFTFRSVLVTLSCLLLAVPIGAQTPVTRSGAQRLTGIVYDLASGEMLSQAFVYVPYGVGDVTDEEGSFGFDFPDTARKFTVESVGYVTRRIALDHSATLRVSVGLPVQRVACDQVTVVDPETNEPVERPPPDPLVIFIRDADTGKGVADPALVNVVHLPTGQLTVETGRDSVAVPIEMAATYGIAVKVPDYRIWLLESLSTEQYCGSRIYVHALLMPDSAR